jgi:5-methyltetrahydropteroyltriglutamate--homocysteine methyltransferase
MLNATRDEILPTTITGSYPRPQWFTEVLRGRAFKDALGDSTFREQYLDAVSCLVRDQERAGLDIVTDGDSRFDLTVGGKSWFYYPIERLRGITGHQDRSTAGGWTALKPGHILYEVMEAYQPAVVARSSPPGRSTTPRSSRLPSASRTGR